MIYLSQILSKLYLFNGGEGRCRIHGCVAHVVRDGQAEWAQNGRQRDLIMEGGGSAQIETE